MAPKRHAKPLYDFDGLVAAARRQSIDVREDNGHFYFSNKHGMVDMRREEVTAGRRSWNSHVSRLRRIGLVWANRTEVEKSEPLVEVTQTTYPSLAHVDSGPGILFELPYEVSEANEYHSVEESAQVIEIIEETEKKDMTEEKRLKELRSGVPKGWSSSEARTKEYRDRIHKEARKFLREFLKDGPKEVHEIVKAAQAAGLTWYQVEKASTSLKIVKKHHGPRYPGTWELPRTSQAPLPDSGKQGLATSFVSPPLGAMRAVSVDAPASAPEGRALEARVDQALRDAGYREVPPASPDTNAKPRNADPGPGTYPPPEPARTGIVAPDVSPAAGHDFQSPHRSPFALGIADLVEQELTFRVKEYVERVERLEREKSELLQQLADQQHEHDRNWDKIQQEALEAAQKSVAEAIAAAKKRS